MAPEAAGQLAPCPVCATPTATGDLFCEECGANLSEPAPATAPTPTAVNGASAPAASGAYGPNAAPSAPEPPATDSFRIAPAGAAGPAAPHSEHAGPEAPDSDGFRLAAPGAEPAGRSGSGGPDGPGGPAPADPRAALGAPGGPPGFGAATVAGVKTCVACRTGTIDADGYCENCGHAQPRERDRMERELPGLAAVSDRGLRHHRNEDSFALDTTRLPNGTPAVIAVVCDGVSSATRPDEASEAAAEAARASLLDSLARGTHPQQAMHEALLVAARSVAALAGDVHNRVAHSNAPACTCVAAVVAGGILTVGWVGDSRAYWVPDDRTAPAARLTEDDSWAAQMVATGLMSEAEAYADERAHAITGWLGADAHELDPHTQSFQPQGPGVVVVCTDGLWNYAEGAQEMAAVVADDARSRPLHSAQALVGHALDGGGHDNVTVAIVPFPAG
ncbi:PP2C family protein-serine/threonine phosphatase [Streptomyces polyrhachis]|uniref:PP2C family protein-serine/threonine phosphatase n=1 Tax=Streptomyces polyrhachis TaxID=1282885 RepID=A0ABW2GHG5_9ACTN